MMGKMMGKRIRGLKDKRKIRRIRWPALAVLYSQLCQLRKWGERKRERRSACISYANFGIGNKKIKGKKEDNMNE